MYAVKHFASSLANPLLVATLLLGLALVCRALSRRRLSGGLFVVAFSVAYLGSLPLVGGALLRPLESRYAALDETVSLPKVNYVVVLGSGYHPRPGVPVTAALNADGLARIVEGVRLWRHLKSGRLVLSGGAPPNTGEPPAKGYALLARDLGVEADSLTVLDQAQDTQAEARVLAPVVRGSRFILVTSAFHMPRAMRLMQLAGLRPIPAPTQQSVISRGGFRWADALPDWSGMRDVQRGLHEYMGLAALSMGFE